MKDIIFYLKVLLHLVFFVEMEGQKTIVELELKNKNQYFMMDEIATIKGVLKLNADDIYQCVYILQNAEVSR